MSCQNFALPTVVKQFKLTVSERPGIYAQVPPAEPSPWLRETLTEGMPLATSINTEKARSEMLIAPVLIEVRRLLERRVGLFSGVSFPVDPAQGLAAQIFNSQEASAEAPAQGPIFGAVSTGEIWRFLSISGQSVQIDLSSYVLADVAKILGILRAMLTGGGVYVPSSGV